MLQVALNRIQVNTRIGIYDWEQAKDQTLYISLLLDLNSDDAVRSDELDDTVDYEMIQNDVIAIVSQGSFALIEKVAHDVYQHVLLNDRVRSVLVTVEKPGALEHTEMVSVTYSGD